MTNPRPRSLRGFAVRMRDWAALDVAAAIDHMRSVWPKLPLSVVGHSFGGQALGLAPNNDQVSRALFVAAQAGYWRLFHSPEKYRVYAMLRLIGAPVARTLGYVPGRLGIGEDLPRDVFLEWTGWVMKKRYFFDDAGRLSRVVDEAAGLRGLEATAAFIQKHVWPGPVAAVDLGRLIRVLTDAGFNVHEIGDDTLSYAYTVRDWARGLEAHHADLAARFDEASVRTFLLLFWSSYHFL